MVKERESIVIKSKIRDGEYTLQEIADELNISKERVRQILDTAIKKLRHPKTVRKMRKYLED